MAEQSGIIPLKGTLGNITFYKSKDGNLARERGSLNGKRIASDPAFQRTRENNAEFGRAGLAGKLLRSALRALLQNASDSKMVSRLTAEMMKVIKADLTSTRGMRNVIDGETEFLQGFDFNIAGKLSTTLFAPFTSGIDRATGLLDVSIPSFIPLNMIVAPGGTTHYRINSAGVEIDFEEKRYTIISSSTEEMLWDNLATADIALSNALPAASTHPLFLALGIEFFQQVNGTLYSLKSGAFNALSLVNVLGL